MTVNETNNITCPHCPHSSGVGWGRKKMNKDILQVGAISAMKKCKIGLRRHRESGMEKCYTMTGKDD